MWTPWKNQPRQDDSPSEPEVPDEIITREFAAEGSLLQLLTMDADTVITSGGENISVTVTGYQSKLDKLVVDNTGGLSVTSQRPSTTVSVKINGKSLWRLLLAALRGDGDEMLKVTDLGSDKHKLKIRATVPDGTNLVLRDYSGDVMANGVYGEVKADVSYDSMLRLDRLNILDVQGDSGLFLAVNYIEGNAHVESGYDSKIKILDGVLGECVIRTDSDVNVHIKARCSEVVVSSSYNCIFRFGVITSRLTANVDSSSEIYFECDEANQVEVRTSDDCTVTGSGKARRAVIRTDSDCKVTLGEVTDRLEAECSYDCSMITNRGEGTSYVDIQMDSGADVQLMGLIASGRITTSYDSTVLVGVLGSGVRTTFDGDTRLSTGYMSVN